MNLNFRLLRADEIECRIAQVAKDEQSAMFLLYKDARCDMNILDEVVGCMNWQRLHARDNANCVVSIWDEEKKQWVSKEDTGTESNTEKEKGLASDSFKRACVNWGIGRELYTAPKGLWIKAMPNEKIRFSRFEVKAIHYTKKIIDGLVICDMNNNIRYSIGVDKILEDFFSTNEKALNYYLEKKSVGDMKQLISAFGNEIITELIKSKKI